jgi:predicted Ser/Thr protein kinase
MTSLRDRAGQAGPYRLLHEIGAGGMGEVHLALDGDGRTVAVKVLHPAVARDEVARRRLGREVATMRRVRSPYVAEVLDADIGARRPYIVTRYVQGRSLDQRVRSGGPLRGAPLRRTARGLARALYAIHEAEVVHRDLKPANVILVEENPVVIDFGLAHVLDATRLTRTGIGVGTPGYLAPEILDGGRPGPAADIFSWGATVAFAATGRSAYGPGPAEAIFSRVLRGRHELTGVPADLRPAIEAVLAVDPDDRPCVTEILQELAAARVRRRSAAPPRVPRTPRPVPVAPPLPAAPPEPHEAEDASAGEDAPPAEPERPPACAEPPEPPEVEPPDPARLVRACLALAVPAACYVLPTIAIAVTLSLCGAVYTWDALVRARRRTRAARSRLARAAWALGAVVTVPVGTAARLTVLLLALAGGYAAALAATWWSVTPHERALAVPLGVLAIMAGGVRARYAASGRVVRAGVWLIAAVPLTAVAVAGPHPAWWPLVLS